MHYFSYSFLIFLIFLNFSIERTRPSPLLPNNIRSKNIDLQKQGSYYMHSLRFQWCMVTYTNCGKITLRNENYLQPSISSLTTETTGTNYETWNRNQWEETNQCFSFQTKMKGNSMRKKILYFANIKSTFF